MMKIRSYLKAALTLPWLVAASGCYLLTPPPTHVRASVALGDGNVPHFESMPCILDEWELRGLTYYLSGVEVDVDDCPGPQCGHRIWNIQSDAVWNNRVQPAAGLVPLPKSVGYGEAIEGMRVDTPPEALKPNVKYSVVIGVMALDRYHEKRYFSANVDFSLREGGDGKLEVNQRGACPIKAKD